MVTSQGMPTVAGSPQKLGGLGPVLPQNLQKEPTLPSPGFWTSGPLNCERINSYYFKPPVCDAL